MTFPSEFIYRFRSTEALLEWQELEQQEIYFASPNQLNDPIEGFKDIFWYGDEIIWRNFLKHYLLCLERVCLEYTICERDLNLSGSIPVFLTEQDLETDEYRNRYREICNVFFQEKSIVNFLKCLDSEKRIVRRNEMLFYLKQLHLYALNVILSNFENSGFLNKKSYGNLSTENTIKYVEDLVNIVTTHSKTSLTQNQIEDIYIKLSHNIEQRNYLNIGYKNQDHSTPKKIWFNLFLNFPSEYIINIERLIYPYWYTASFCSDFRNPTIWGHYADSHKGCCLKFKTNLQKEDLFINLFGITGRSASSNAAIPAWQSSSTGSSLTNGDLDCATDKEGSQNLLLSTTTSPSEFCQAGIAGSNGKWKFESNTTAFRFYRVKYEQKYPSVDFFKSLGQLPFGCIIENWFKDRSRNRSICHNEFFKDLGWQKTWRDKYWEEFYDCISTKLDSWSYEKEYRLFISSPEKYDNKAKEKKFKYELTNLDGIIFGIKTSYEDKLQIMEIMKRKCAEVGHKDLKLYQAYYSPRSGKIEYSELGKIATS